MKKPTVKSENELLPNWNYDDVSSGRSNVLKVREFNYLRGQILYKIRTILIFKKTRSIKLKRVHIERRALG